MKKIILLILSISILISSFSYAENHSATYTLSNEFISIIVNNQDAIGRFALETTGGDPSHLDDDNSSLIYGRPIPWTSYTTILIDNDAYIFGNPGKRLLRRLQKEIKFGQFLSQHQTEDSIITSFKFDDILVRQTLTFYRNPNTNVKDSALIRYDVLNQSDTVSHNVGIRIMLDTKLGQNDGSPLRMGPESVREEKLYPANTLYDYWMAFDNIVSPNIVAQGLLKDASNQLTFPDKLYLANWGTLVDEPWDIDYQVGRSFIRKGEQEKDTALGIYFEPVVIEPNQNHFVQTVYGLGGLSLSPGKLAVGLSMPQELPAGFPDTFLIQGYVLNTGAYKSHDTKITFELGKDILPIENGLISTFNILDVGQQIQIPLVTKLSETASSGKVPITLKVDSSTYEENTLTRHITLIPRLTLDFTLNPIETVDYEKHHLALVSGFIQNTSTKKITKIKTDLSLPPGLSFPDYESKQKRLPILEPGQRVDLNWTVSIDEFNPKYELIFSTNSAYTKQKNYKENLFITQDKGYRILNSQSELVPKENFYLRLDSYREKALENVNIKLEFNPEHLAFQRLSAQKSTRDTINKPETMILNSNSIELIGITTKQDKDTLLRLAKFHFKALKPGVTEVLLYVDNTFLFTFPIQIEKELKK